MPFFSQGGGGDYKILTGDNIDGGNNSLAVNTGTKNIALGNGALQNSTTGHSNIAIGYNAGYGITSVASQSNVIIGNYALETTIATESVIIGHLTAENRNSQNDVLIGYRAGRMANNPGTTNSDNVCLGTSAGYSKGTFARNQSTAVGSNASGYGGNGGASILPNSVAIGYLALHNNSANQLTASNTIAIGSNTGNLLIGGAAVNCSDSIYIGANIRPTTSNEIIIGDTNKTIMQIGNVFFGAGAPSAGIGVNGSFWLRSDGGVLTTIYQKRAGTWVGIV